ncbi:hypothetical protein AK830_g8293 [Neonectria ditissima]|uniref:Uncharacterized protein n=1 Tax=Neonectria ditissima TaxID=78410 RepID=A0A0N8H685_9HYPO|nr:hypothetical protein AK830_g8293 [Neonectria ditissima]
MLWVTLGLFRGGIRHGGSKDQGVFAVTPDTPPENAENSQSFCLQTLSSSSGEPSEPREPFLKPKIPSYKREPSLIQEPSLSLEDVEFPSHENEPSPVRERRPLLPFKNFESLLQTLPRTLVRTPSTLRTLLRTLPRALLRACIVQRLRNLIALERFETSLIWEVQCLFLKTEESRSTFRPQFRCPKPSSVPESTGLPFKNFEFPKSYSSHQLIRTPTLPYLGALTSHSSKIYKLPARALKTRKPPMNGDSTAPPLENQSLPVRALEILKPFHKQNYDISPLQDLQAPRPSLKNFDPSSNDSSDLLSLRT